MKVFRNTQIILVDVNIWESISGTREGSKDKEHL